MRVMDACEESLRPGKKAPPTDDNECWDAKSSSSSESSEDEEDEPDADADPPAQWGNS